MRRSFCFHLCQRYRFRLIAIVAHDYAYPDYHQENHNPNCNVCILAHRDSIPGLRSSYSSILPYNTNMSHMPWWGTELYSPENLQKRAGVYSTALSPATWSDVLRGKRGHLIGLFVWRVFAMLFLVAASTLLVYIALAVMHPGEKRYIPALLAAGFLLLAYSYVPATVRLCYFLYVDRRDIAAVLRQDNSDEKYSRRP